MVDEKVIVKAHVGLTFTFEEQGHLTMNEIRNKVKDLLKDTGGTIKDIKVKIVENA